MLWGLLYVYISIVLFKYDYAVLKNLKIKSIIVNEFCGLTISLVIQNGHWGSFGYDGKYGLMVSKWKMNCGCKKVNVV